MLYDKDIREPLCDFLDDLYFPNRILDEQVMGKSRADMVMVTKTALFGIEIKSDADSYSRLSRQINDYDKYYDYNFVVVGTKHAHSIKDKVPDYWGIITVEESDDKIDFYTLRLPSINPKMKWEYKLRILWRPEMAHIQKLTEMPAYKQKSKAFVIDKMIEKLDKDLLQFHLCDELFERDYNKIVDIINNYRKEQGRGKKRKIRRKLK